MLQVWCSPRQEELTSALLDLSELIANEHETRPHLPQALPDHSHKKDREGQEASALGTGHAIAQGQVRPRRPSHVRGFARSAARLRADVAPSV